MTWLAAHWQALAGVVVAVSGLAILAAVLLRLHRQRQALARAWRPGPEARAAVRARAEQLAGPRADLTMAPLPAGVRPSTHEGCFWRGTKGCLRFDRPCTGEAGCDEYLPAHGARKGD